MKCLYCDTEKDEADFSEWSFLHKKQKCKACTAKAKGARAVRHAKACDEAIKERGKLIESQQSERLAKKIAELESAATAKKPVKIAKRSPELKNKMDDYLYRKELDSIDSELEL